MNKIDLNEIPDNEHETEELNDGMYLQTADRVSCLIKIMDSLLKDMPVIEAQHRWKEFIDEAKQPLEKLHNEVRKLVVANEQKVVAIDRSYWMFELLHELLMDHPEVQADLKAKKLTKIAADDLWKLYQHLGAK